MLCGCRYLCVTLCFFFSSRRRHTRCALVTGVQTCALPIFDLRWYPEAALTVVMAAQGYPESYEKGTAIRGLDLAAGNSDDVKIFHAGTTQGPDRKSVV